MSYSFRPFEFARDWAWVQSRVKILRVEDVCGIMAENIEGERVGAAVFDSFNHSAAQVTLIMDTPMLVRAGFLELAYHFVFEVCGRRYCYCQVAETNTRSIKLCKSVGWKEKMRVPDGFAEGVDFIIFELGQRDFYAAAQRGLWAMK